MCFSASCPTCCESHQNPLTETQTHRRQTAKATWRGCGSHIPQAMGNIPPSEWCSCPPRVTVNGRQYPAAAPLSIPGLSWVTGWFSGKQQKTPGRQGKGDL